LKLTPRKAALVKNLFGLGKIHMGRLAVPVTIFARAFRRAKRKVKKTMSLRYAPWGIFTDVTPIVFTGGATDWNTVSLPIFPAGAPVPEAIFHYTLCGVWTSRPHTLHGRIIDETGDVVCTLLDIPGYGSLSCPINWLGVLTAIAGRAGLLLQISASSAATFTPVDVGSRGLLIWDE
jgi:hypothetical protein